MLTMGKDYILERCKKHREINMGSSIIINGKAFNDVDLTDKELSKLYKENEDISRWIEQYT